MSADLTRMALRGLALPEAEMDAKLAAASDGMKETLGHEIGTINFVLAAFLIWLEQGTADEVLAYIRSQLRATNAQAA